MQTGVRPRGIWRKRLRFIHLWIGLPLCVPLALLGLTGSVLVFEAELAVWFEPELRNVQPGPMRPIAEIVSAAQTAAPKGLNASLYSAPSKPGQPATVRFAKPGQGRPGPGGLEIVVDPVTLAVLDARQQGERLLRKIFLLHANALVPGPTGRKIIGRLGLAMLALGLTGLAIWWPRPGQWASAFRVKPGTRGLPLFRDLHGSAGIWGLAVFVVVSFTGVYLAFPQTVGAGIRSVVPARDLRALAAGLRVEPVPGAQPANVDAAVALALAAAPGGGVRAVGLPQRPSQPYRIMIASPGHEAGAPMVSVFVDPWMRRVIAVQDPATFSTGERILAWQHAVHAGAGLGWLWRILVFLSGLLPTLFAVTGTTIWLLKRRRRTKSATPEKVRPSPE